MTFTSTLPYFLLMGIYLSIGWAVLVKSRFYSNLLNTNSESRFETIDGLRGFLALGVFFAHGLVTYYYHTTGTWTAPPSAFYTTLAELSVALFFMITAFLFWSRVLQSQGSFKALRLYRSRNRRLTPMYAFSVSVVLIIVAVRTGFELRVDPGELIVQVLRWFSYGFLGVPVMPDINGLKDTHTIQSVIWTLMFEWEFYLLLPLLAMLPARTTLLVVLMSITLFFGPPAIVALNFAFGAVAAYLMQDHDSTRRLKGRQYDVLMVLILAAVLTLFPRGHGLPQYVLIFMFFVLLLHGNDLFGLLRSLPAKLLGAVSYSIYLLHNIVLNQVFYSFDSIYGIETISATTFWLLVGFSGVLVVLFSMLTFRFIEYPFFAKRPLSIEKAKDADKKNGNGTEMADETGKRQAT